MSTKIEVVKLGTSIHLLFKHVSGFTGSTTTDSAKLNGHAEKAFSTSTVLSRSR